MACWSRSYLLMTSVGLADSNAFKISLESILSHKKASGADSHVKLLCARASKAGSASGGLWIGIVGELKRLINLAGCFQIHRMILDRAFSMQALTFHEVGGARRPTLQ
jgi:hypothetical protein